MTMNASGNTQAGYTLIELMVVVVMVAVLASIVGPGFQDSLARNKRQSAMEETLNMLRKARGEAATESAFAVACASANGTTCSETNSWETGHIVFLDNGAAGGTAGDASRQTNEPLLRVRGAAPAGVTVRAVNFEDVADKEGILVFSPQGRPNDNGTFQICDNFGAAEAKAVILNLSGQPRIGIEDSTDGYVDTDLGVNVTCP